MSNFWSCVIAEFQALGAWCIIHGPEIWLGLTVWCVISIVVVLGMWLGALLSANNEKKDRNKNNNMK